MTERPSPEDVRQALADALWAADSLVMNDGSDEPSEFEYWDSVAAGLLTDDPERRVSIVPIEELEALRRLRDAAVAWRSAPLAPLADLIDGINPRGDALDALAAVIDALGEHGEAQR